MEIELSHLNSDVEHHGVCEVVLKFGMVPTSRSDSGGRTLELRHLVALFFACAEEARPHVDWLLENHSTESNLCSRKYDSELRGGLSVQPTHLPTFNYG